MGYLNANAQGYYGDSSAFGEYQFVSLNDIIESVLIPTLPEKLLFALVTAVPTALIWSDAEKYGNIRSNNTASALNVDIPVVPNVFWNIDFISSTVYAIISLIDGEDVDVELQELLNNYSGKVSYDKKFQELAGRKKEFEEFCDMLMGKTPDSPLEQFFKWNTILK